MNDVLENEEFETQEKRPGFLKVLCILSFIVIGISLFFTLIAIVFGPSSEEQLLEQKVMLMSTSNQVSELGADWLAKLYSDAAHVMEATNKQFYFATLTSFIILVTGGLGVIFMWKGKRIGFHMYIIYCLLGAVQSYLFVDPKYISPIMVALSLFFSALFVFMYSRNLKWMK